MSGQFPALLLLLALPTVAAAADELYPTPIGGFAGGIFFTGDEHPLASAPTGVVRLGLKFTPRFDIEADLSAFGAQTRTKYAYPYTSLDPRLNAVVHFNPDSRADIFLAFGGGMLRTEVHRTSAEEKADPEGLPFYRNPSTDLLIDFGPGVTIQLVGPLHLRTDLRVMSSLGNDGTPRYSDKYVAGEWTIGFDLRREHPPDTDGDGYIDKEDGCPDEAEDFDDFEDADGCPDYDNDGDRIEDTADDCPDDPEDHDGYKDTDGCPDLDNDKDGILDMDDGCPMEPEDKDGDRDEDGCPEEDLDTDGDGIVDRFDACPEEPETFNGYDDKDGCPDEIPQEVAKFTGVIKGITFELNSDKIRPSSYPTLDEAMQVLFDFPTVRLEVQGHTDNKGNDAYNLDLSQRRADSVVRWFGDHGVDTSRFVPVGYGEAQPMDTNNTNAGRANNRRVDFQLLTQ